MEIESGSNRHQKMYVRELCQSIGKPLLLGRPQPNPDDICARLVDGVGQGFHLVIGHFSKWRAERPDHPVIAKLLANGGFQVVRYAFFTPAEKMANRLVGPFGKYAFEKVGAIAPRHLGGSPPAPKPDTGHSIGQYPVEGVEQRSERRLPVSRNQAVGVRGTDASVLAGVSDFALRQTLPNSLIQTRIKQRNVENLCHVYR